MDTFLLETLKFTHTLLSKTQAIADILKTITFLDWRYTPIHFVI